MMKILKLTIKKQWFDLIKAGEKKEEYREIKEYWEKRLGFSDLIEYPERYNFTHVHFYNGNSFSNKLPNFIIELKGIEIGTGKTEHGALPDVNYFKLKLGDLIK